MARKTAQTRPLATPVRTGILGHPIGHTASPAMHNAAFRHLGLNWVYEPHDVTPRRLAAVLRRLPAQGVIGVNITLPHKTRAARLLRRLDPAARRIGAVNTILFSKPPRGLNTDGPGLLEALRSELGFDPRGKTVAIAGCGGAGRAAAVALASAGARGLLLLNRTASKARAVARRARAARRRIVIGFKPGPCDLLINATSLGLRAADPLPLSKETLNVLKPRLFMDMIYRPAATPLMREMKKRGAKTCNGLEMLVRQGARAFEVWTGRKAPVGVMRRALKKEIYG